MSTDPTPRQRYLPGASGRSDFHLLLAGIFAPALFVPFGFGLALYHCLAPGLGDDHRRWGRRISVLVAVDLLVALLTLRGYDRLLPPTDDPLGPRVSIGITFDPRTAPRDAVVDAASPGSPAARAGLRRGDAILALDGRPVIDRQSLRRSIMGGRSGVARTLHLRRAGREMDVTVVPDARRRPRQARALFERDPDARPPSWRPSRHELVGFALGAGTLFVLAAIARRHGRAAARPVVATTLVLLGTALVMTGVEAALLRALGPSLGVVLVAAGLSPVVLGLLAAIARARLARGGAPGDMPAPTHSTARGFGWGVYYLFSGSWRVASLMPFIAAALKTRPEPGLVQEAAAQIDFNAGGAALGFLALVVAAPIGEELLFRGVLLPGLLGWCSPAVATLVTAVLFGVLHVPQYGIGAVLIVLYGCVFGWVRLATGRLAASVLLHAFINGVVFAALVYRMLR